MSDKGSWTQAVSEAGAELLLGPIQAVSEEAIRELRTVAVRLLSEIQAMGYVGSISTVRRFLHDLRSERGKGNSSGQSGSSGMCHGA